MINEKDRSQILRMAGNIAAGMLTMPQLWDAWDVPAIASNIAIDTLLAVDKEIEKRNRVQEVQDA